MKGLDMANSQGVLEIVFTVEVDDLDAAKLAVNNLGWEIDTTRNNTIWIVAPINTFTRKRPTPARALAVFWEEYADQLDWNAGHASY